MAKRTRRIPQAPKRRTARPARPRAARKSVRRPRAVRPKLTPAAPAQVLVPELPRPVRFISAVYLIGGFAGLVTVVLGTVILAHHIQVVGDDRLRLGLAAGAAFAVPFNGLAIAVGIELAR